MKFQMYEIQILVLKFPFLVLEEFILTETFIVLMSYKVTLLLYAAELSSSVVFPPSRQ